MTQLPDLWTLTLTQIRSVFHWLPSQTRPQVMGGNNCLPSYSIFERVPDRTKPVDKANPIFPPPMKPTFRSLGITASLDAMISDQESWHNETGLRRKPRVPVQLTRMRNSHDVLARFLFLLHKMSKQLELHPSIFSLTEPQKREVSTNCPVSALVSDPHSKLPRVISKARWGGRKFRRHFHSHMPAFSILAVGAKLGRTDYHTPATWLKRFIHIWGMKPTFGNKSLQSAKAESTAVGLHWGSPIASLSFGLTWHCHRGRDWTEPPRRETIYWNVSHRVNHCALTEVSKHGA